jgi:TctA family transporter
MKQNDKQTSQSRRTFLRGTVLTSAGAAVATAVPGIAAASVAEAGSEADGKKKGYRLTRHIADYYKTAAS